MILEEALNKLVRDIINDVLIIPGYTIKAKQNAPRPTGSYADVDFLTDTGIGWEQRNKVDNIADPDITESISGARQISLSIGFYRTNSMDNARSVRTAFFRQSVIEILSASGIGLVSRSQVRDISEPLENGWEERAQFDIVLSAVGTDVSIVRSILTVSIDGDFETRGKSIPINVEVTT